MVSITLLHPYKLRRLSILYLIGRTMTGPSSSKDIICVLSDERLVLCEGVIVKDSKKEYVISGLLESIGPKGQKIFKPCPVAQ
jgi:hypothetical protein